MGPSCTYHPPEGDEFENSVEQCSPLCAEPAVGYCSRRPRPSPMWGSRFLGAGAVGPWVGEQKPLGKIPQRGNPSPKLTYLPTWLAYNAKHRIDLGIQHFCITYTPKSSPTEDLLEVEVVGSVTRSGRDQIGLQEDKEGRTLYKMAQESHYSPILD